MQADDYNTQALRKELTRQGGNNQVEVLKDDQEFAG